jgi:hypothetical protein
MHQRLHAVGLGVSQQQRVVLRIGLEDVADDVPRLGHGDAREPDVGADVDQRSLASREHVIAHQRQIFRRVGLGCEVHGVNRVVAHVPLERAEVTVARDGRHAERARLVPEDGVASLRGQQPERTTDGGQHHPAPHGRHAALEDRLLVRF